MKSSKSRAPSSCLSCLTVVSILLLNPVRVWAHAVIVESTPAANSVVKGPSIEIKLRFNVRIDASRSKLTLKSPDGHTRAVGLAPQISPDLLLASVPDLPPGQYRLHWQVLASDGHITLGDIPFSVVGP